MQILVKPDGLLVSIYAETLDFSEFGVSHIRRASHVEPNLSGDWIADLTSVRGPKLGPFARRSEAIDAELDWLSMMLNELEPFDENT